MKISQYIRGKAKYIFFIIILLPLNIVAQCPEIWNRADSINLNRAYNLFQDYDINSIEGIWENRNGVIFMIERCPANECMTDYRMVMLVDKVYYGDVHIKVPAGSVIGTISKTANKNIFSCKYRRKNKDPFTYYHITLTKGKLSLVSGSNLSRRLFAVKIYPTENNSEKTGKNSPFENGSIDRESNIKR